MSDSSIWGVGVVQIPGPPGPPGPPPELITGTVAATDYANVIITQIEIGKYRVDYYLPRGLTGTPGAPGLPGPPGGFRYIEVAELPYGQPPSGTISGESPNATLHLNIPAGAPGQRGDPGTPAKLIELGSTSTHMVWRLEGDTTWTNLIAWADLKGPKGDQGNPGAKGDPGTGVNIRGTLANESLLPTPPLFPSDAYIISGDLFVWTGTAWANVGVVQGPSGEDGPSAYEVAVANGFIGTEIQWLNSLVGPQGNPGQDATIGPFLIVTASGASRNFVSSDLGKLIVTNAIPLNFVAAVSTFPVGWWCRVYNINTTSPASLGVPSGVTLTPSAYYLSQGEFRTLIKLTATAIHVV